MAIVTKLQDGALKFQEDWLEKLNLDANESVEVEIFDHQVTIKPTDKQELSISEDLPPKIQALLRKKGWNWPPDEKLKAQMREAAEKFVGSIKFDKEVQEELDKTSRWYRGDRSTIENYVWLDAPIFRKAKEIAQEKGIPLSQLVNRWLEKLMEGS